MNMSQYWFELFLMHWKVVLAGSKADMIKSLLIELGE